MKPSTLVRTGAGVALASLLLATSGEAQIRVQVRPPSTRPTTPVRPAGFVPRFAALAETRLLMEGLANANYRSLQRLLKEKPADAETWTFVRGQALLIGETGNLLLLRPPRNSGRDTWMKLAMAMRDRAADLARKAAAQDFEGSKTSLANLTTSCNNCHQTFRVRVRVGPEMEKEERDTD
jgi:hypothetical protein